MDKIIDWALAIILVALLVLGIDWLIITGWNYVAPNDWHVGYWKGVVIITLIGFFSRMIFGKRK